MTTEECLIVSLFGCETGVVVGRVAVDEAVRHDKVDGIGGCETLPLCRVLLPFQDAVRDGESLAFPGETEVYGAGGCIGSESDVHEEVVRTFSLMDLLDADSFAPFKREVPGGDVLSLDKKLERGLHANPPKRWLDSGDQIGRCHDVPIPRSLEGDTDLDPVVTESPPVAEFLIRCGKELEPAFCTA